MANITYTPDPAGAIGLTECTGTLPVFFTPDSSIAGGATVATTTLSVSYIPLPSTACATAMIGETFTIPLGPARITFDADQALYDIGDYARLSATFTSAGVYLDPTLVTLKVKDPTGTVTTYTFGTSPILIRHDTGQYRFDYNITMAGTHYYRWSGTAPCQAAGEGLFTVSATRFA